MWLLCFLLLSYYLTLVRVLFPMHRRVCKITWEISSWDNNLGKKRFEWSTAVSQIVKLLFHFFQPNWRSDYSWPPPWEVEEKLWEEPLPLPHPRIALPYLMEYSCRKVQNYKFCLETWKIKWNWKTKTRPQFEEEGRRR